MLIGLDHRRAAALLAALALVLSWPLAGGAGAQTPPQEHTYLVIGAAPVDAADGRRAAVADALAHAVARELEALLGAEALGERFEELAGRVLAQPERYVRDYQVIGESAAGGRTRLLVRATVAEGALRADVEGPVAGAAVPSEPPPPAVVVVLITEQNVDDMTPRFWWGRGAGEQAMTATEALAEALAGRGLTVPAASVLRQREGVDWRRFDHAELTFREAAELGRQLGAGLVVLGNALAVPSSAEVGADLKAMKGTVIAHVVDAGSAEEVSKVTESALGMHPDEVEAGVEALANAGRIAGEALAQKIIQARQAGPVASRRLAVVVEGAGNLVHFVQFRRALGALDGVEGVRVGEMGTSEATLVVSFRGEGEQLAARLQAQRFDGFGVRLLEIEPDRLRVALIAG